MIATIGKVINMKFIAISSGFTVLFASMSMTPVFGEEPVIPYHYSSEWSLVSAPPPAGPYHPVNIDPRVPGAGSVESLPMFPPRQEDIPSASAERMQPDGQPPVAAQTMEPETGSVSVVEPLIPSTEPAGNAEAASPATARDETSAPENSAASVEQEISESVPGSAPAAGIAARQAEPANAAAALRSMEPPPVSDVSGGGSYGYRSPGWAPLTRGLPAPGYGMRMPPPAPQSYDYPPAGYPSQPMYRSERNLPPPGYYNPSGRDEGQEIPPPPFYDGMYGRRPYQGADW
jgi:hypothetical protein